MVKDVSSQNAADLQNGLLARHRLMSQQQQINLLDTLYTQQQKEINMESFNRQLNNDSILISLRQLASQRRSQTPASLISY